MGVVIDSKKCIRCGHCAEICPEDILLLAEEGVKVVYPGECCWCGSCMIDCPAGAVKVRFDRSVGPVFCPVKEWSEPAAEVEK